MRLEHHLVGGYVRYISPYIIIIIIKQSFHIIILSPTVDSTVTLSTPKVVWLETSPGTPILPGLARN